MQAGSNVYAPLPPLTAFCPPRGVEYWKKDAAEFGTFPYLGNRI